MLCACFAVAQVSTFTCGQTRVFAAPSRFHKLGAQARRGKCLLLIRPWQNLEASEIARHEQRQYIGTVNESLGL